MAATTGALESCGREQMSRLGCDVTCRPFWAWVVVRFVSDRRVDLLVLVVISIAFALGGRARMALALLASPRLYRLFRCNWPHISNAMDWRWECVRSNVLLTGA